MTEDNIKFELDGVGLITMTGIGPWRARGHDIRDSNNVVANPTVVQPFSTVTKPNSNVVFAKTSTRLAVVEMANSILEAKSDPAAPGFPNKVDG